MLFLDLDGTLTKSKTDIDPETAGLLSGLLRIKVAIIGGGKYDQIQKQLLDKFNPDDFLNNLFCFR